MTATRETITANIVLQLRNANGSGGYTNDLSGTGGVRRARPSQSEATKGVHVWGVSVKSTSDGAAFGQWRRDFEAHISGYLGPGGDPEDRQAAAAALAADIHLAIETDRSLGGATLLGGPIRDLEITDSDIEDERGVQGVEVVLKGNWRSGAGGV